VKSWPGFLRRAALLVLLPLAAAATDVVRDDFAFSIALAVPDGAPLVRVDVPLAVYRDCVDPALRDLRVLNGAGEVVPFSVQRPPIAVRGIPTTLRLPLFALRDDGESDVAALQLRIDSGQTSIALEGGPTGATTARVVSYLVNASGQDKAIDTLRFEWPEDGGDFAANVVIEHSDDLVDWRMAVPRAPLARLRQGGATFEQRSVPVPPTRARYWRVRAAADNRLPDIVAAEATFVIGAVPVDRVSTEVGSSSVANEPGVYDFDLGAQLPVDRLELLMPDINTVANVEVSARRGATDPWHFLTSDSVYRIQAATGELLSPPLVLRAAPARFWRIKVDPRGGGIGGGSLRLRAGWLADQLVFVTRGAGPFELVYGSFAAPAAAVPLDAMLSRTGSASMNALDIPMARADEPRVAGGRERLVAPPPPPAWRQWILWLALVAGVVTLGALAWSLARQMRESS
jgi:uncharacterized protein DUF3999